MRSARLLMASLLVVGSLSAAAMDQKINSSPTDGNGDPLPRGAIARLGSRRWRLHNEPRGLVLSPDGRSLAVSTNDGTIDIIDTKTGRWVQSFGTPTVFGFGPRMPAAFSPDGKALAYLDTSEQHQVLRIRQLGDKREQSISFRTKDHYEPKLPPELTKEGLTQDRGEYITALAFSPDSTVLAAAVHFHFKIKDEKERVLREVDENVLRSWRVSSGKKLAACSGHTRTISGIFFSSDGKTLTTASEDGTVRFWDTATGKENRRRWKADDPLFCAASSPDGKWFAAGSKKEVLLWEAGTETVRHRLALPAEEVRSLVFTPDSKQLVGGGGTILRLWEPDTGKLVGKTPALPQPVMALAFSAEGNLLFLGQQGEQVVRRREAATLKPADEWKGHPRPVEVLGYTADNNHIITSTIMDDFHCWNARTGQACPVRGKDTKPFRFAHLTSSIGRKALLIPDTVNVITTSHVYLSVIVKPSRRPKIAWHSGRQGGRQRWDNGKAHRSKGIGGSCVACSTDGRRLLLEQTKDKRSTLIVLDMESYKKLRELPQTEENVQASLSPDGRTLAVATSNQLLFVDVDSGRQRRYPLPGAKVPLRFSSSLIFSPDGSRIAVLDQDGKARIVSVRDGRLVNLLESEQQEPISGLIFSADGKRCLCSVGNSAWLWEVATNQRIRSYTGSSCLFSPDNRLLAIQNKDALCLHDLYSGKKLRTFKDVTGFAGAGNFIFSPDGKQVATAGRDTTVLLWEAVAPEIRENKTALDEKTLDRLWTDLKSDKAVEAYSAMGRLIADPPHALTFLHKHLRYVAPVEENRLRQWIADLDSDSFAKREAASRELAQVGSVAESALRKALTGPTSPEMRRRIKELLQPFEATDMHLSPEELAHLRAIQVLEGIGTVEARQLLKHLAKGAEGVARTREAQEALQRMRAQGK